MADLMGCIGEQAVYFMHWTAHLRNYTSQSAPAMGKAWRQLPALVGV